MSEPNASPLSCRDRWLAVGLMCLAFVVPAVACILAGVTGNAQWSDAMEFHLPTTRLFAAQWPDFNFRSYPAAMTPGYHLLMAALLKAGSCETGLALATAGLSAGLLGTLAWAASARAGSVLDTLLLCLPMAWSQYVLPAGIYVAPHNFAWWAVLVTLLIAIHACQSNRLTAGFYLTAALALVWAVLARQIHLWVLGPIVAAAWALADSAKIGPRLGRAALALTAAIPAVLTLGFFVRQWGGLTPPGEPWVRPVGGVNFGAVAMMLASLGFVGVWFVPRLLASTSTRSAACVRWGLAGAALALVVSAIGPTTYDTAAGRWSGLWNLVRFAPVVAERSLLVLGLATAGGFVAGVMLAAVPSRPRWVLAAGLAGFAAAHATINQAWQRFYEPMMLMSLVLAVATLPAATRHRLWVRLPLVALIIVQAALTIGAIF